MRFAPDEFHVQKFHIGKASDEEIGKLLVQIATENIDVVHFFWREAAFKMFQPDTILTAAKTLQMDFNDIIDVVGNRVFTTSVYDHLFANGEAFQRRANSFHMVDAYSVSSQKLFNVYNSAHGIPAPDAIITDGVDLELFTPAKADAEKLKNPRVGWVGNSAWGENLGTDPKGYHRLFKPAMEILQQNNPNIMPHIADRQVTHIPFSDMPDYYRSVDLLACTSSMEGTPNPVLEAMASGVPVVATNVGVVPELFGPLQSRYMFNNPSPEMFANAMSMILNDEDHYRALALENQQNIKNWSWKNRVQPWWDFWLNAVHQAQNPRLTKRRQNALSQRCIAQTLAQRPLARPSRLLRSGIRLLGAVKARLTDR